MEGEQPQAQQRREREHFFGAAKLMAGLTLISRVFGMLRDMAVVSLGANRATDAFWLTFQIPNLFRRLFGEGALASAFVPVFTETEEKSGFEKARKLLANAMGLLAVFLLGLMVLIMLGLWAWGALWPGNWDRQLLIGLLLVMLPFMVSICLLALGSAALNCRGHFFFPALAPMVLNICMIAAAWWVVPVWRESLSQNPIVSTPAEGGAPTVMYPRPLYVIAASVAVAGIIQLAGMLWFLKRSGFQLRPFLRPVEGGIRPMLKLMAPMLLGLGFLQFSSLFDSAIAWVFTATPSSPTLDFLGFSAAKPLTEGVLARINAAQRLYQFPMGVLAISLGVAVFPLLARYSARGDKEGLRDSVNRALRLALMEGLATGTGLLVLAEPITRLIYMRGRFGTEDAHTSAVVLQLYVLGMWAYCTTQILTRAFYALKDTTTPLKVSCSLVVLNMLMVATLVWVPGLGPGGFGLATAATASMNCLILIWVLRKRVGLLGGRKIARSVLRSLAACAAMALVVVLMRWQMARMADWKVVAACVPAGAAAFLLTAHLLKAPELRELLRKA